jgi:hypothetical protein
MKLTDPVIQGDAFLGPNAINAFVAGKRGVTTAFTRVIGLARVVLDTALFLETHTDLCVRVAVNFPVCLTVGIVSGRAVDTRLHSVLPAVPIAVVVRQARNV